MDSSVSCVGKKEHFSWAEQRLKEEAGLCST